MSKSLVIIESPGKIKKYKQYLPSGFDVVASMGHIFDLPKKDLGVDLKNDFKTSFVLQDDKKDTLADIQQKVSKADIIYIMSDPDREGSGIGINIAENLKISSSVLVKRAVTQSITKTDIINAINSAYDLTKDRDLFESFLARRVVDRLCGYKTSFLIKQATGGTSAGRVQSAALHILVDREKEIQNFKPEEYWPILAELLTAGKEKILAAIKVPDQHDIKNGADAKKIVDIIKRGPAIVSKFDKKDVYTKASPPFTTSSLYQAAGSILGWKSERTASVAQKLYEAGAITYHRTDSTFLIPEFIKTACDLIEADYGKPYLPAKLNTFAVAKSAQQAHEACRVTDLAVTSFTSGSPEEAKLYQMVWKRSVASQMSDMKKMSMSAEFTVDKYILSATGSKLLFDGWRKVWDYGSISDTILPELKIGEKLDVIDVTTEQKFTQPPNRYNEQSLIKKLEQEGIGRPSTYASIIPTLKKRYYVESEKNITVTPLGIKVIDFMINVGFCFVDVKFTSDLEQKLDDIASKRTNRLTVLDEFWTRLKSDINKSKSIKKITVLSTFPCPDCKKKGVTAFLVLRESRFGKFFSCEHSSIKKDGCKYKADVGDDGSPVEKVKKEVKESIYDCPLCKKKLVIRVSKRTSNEFLGCRGWPACNSGIFDLDGKPIQFKAKKNWGKKRWGKKKDKNGGDES